jgi:hypothetical protein
MAKCNKCQKNFEILKEDTKFYKKINVPAPTFCPTCRYEKRIAFRNDRNLYHRKCGMCEKKIISIYKENTQFPVYCQKCWWSDDWNALDYGEGYNLDKPFFEQFQELLNKVPKVALYNIQAENSQYCNFCMGNKNCYLVFGSDKNHSCLYCDWIYECKDTVDSSYCYNSELLYMCIDCINCYHCFHCQDCEQCNDCYLSIDLKGCKNCFGCIGLRHKEYYLFNKPVEKKEYEKFINNLDNVDKYRDKLEKLSKIVPKKYLHSVNCENVIGDFVVNSKNVFMSFDIRNGQNIRYCDHIFDKAKDCADCSYSGEIELCYDSYEVHGFNLKFCNRCWPSSNSVYLDNCDFCDNCFGCAGLRKSIGEWGKFFPASMSPFLEKKEKINSEFKMIPQEIQFYEKNNIPFPKKHPNQRYKERMDSRNPKKLWDRKCDKCSADIKTSYSPDRPEKVYCKKCYLEEIY